MLPKHLIPNFDAWSSPEEERKRLLRSEWLRDNDQEAAYFFEWMPAHLKERRRLAGPPPRIPARRKGPLPEKVRRLLADLEQKADDSG